MVDSTDNHDLDADWVALIMNARSLGFTKEDVRKVLLALKDNGQSEMQETAV